MPTVPIEENRVGLAAVTDAKFRPGDYTGTGLQAVGSGLATLGEALGGVSKDLQKKQQLIAAQRESDDAAAADAALKQSYTLYDTRAREILRSGDQAYFNRTGQAAVDAAGSMAVELGRYRDEARQRLDPHVAAMFDRMIVPRIDQDIAGIQTYANEQKRVWQGEQSGHVMEASAANALDHVGMPQFVDHVATGLRALDNRALVEGWDPARKIAAEHDYVSNIHKQAVDGLTVGDAIAADAYYRAHQNEMTARDRAEIEESLRQPLLERRAAAVIDTYGASAAGDRAGPAEPYAPRNADLPAIYSYLAEQDLPPEVEEAALNDAAARAAQNERRIAQDQRAARDTAFELTDRLGEGFTSVAQLPPAMRRNLDPEALEALTRQARHNARPEPVKLHSKAAYDLTMLASTDRQAFVERDLRLDRDRMTPEDYDALNAAQRGWRSDPPANDVIMRQRVWEGVQQSAMALRLNAAMSRSVPVMELPP
ncbi:hypothetical protein G4G27_14920 [Sphingomonas sp. So64.6b]|uniref:hypothetical protein n=1 Tax=Sphingomonas sp. So64.6b TaxID=2997354 RepID=UPI0015FFE473|nr:hypothetical protein [Sphingomonas sp. So64.6b]QNA85144.1 hypothetical protein G4G27_14920 [Sphingomonas sp. So64.6b]